MAVLGAKQKGRPFYLPLFDDEEKTKVSRRRKWDLFLALLGAEREGEQRARRFMAKEEEKIVYGAQELMKHVMRHNTSGTSAKRVLFSLPYLFSHVMVSAPSASIRSVSGGMAPRLRPAVV